MHKTIEPTILYFGTPVALISTINPDGTPNLAPMSSAWWLGWSCMLGLGQMGQTSDNLIRTRECVINLPSEDLVLRTERRGAPVAPGGIRLYLIGEPGKPTGFFILFCKMIAAYAQRTAVHSPVLWSAIWKRRKSCTASVTSLLSAVTVILAPRGSSCMSQ